MRNFLFSSSTNKILFVYFCFNQRCGFADFAVHFRLAISQNGFDEIFNQRLMHVSMRRMMFDAFAVFGFNYNFSLIQNGDVNRAFRAENVERVLWFARGVRNG